MRAQKQRIVPLVLLNIILLVILVFILDYFGIISIKKIFKSGTEKITKTKVITEDPFLLEKEELRKQWMVLEEKERLHLEKVNDLTKKEQVLDEKLKEADNLSKIAKEMQKKQEELKKQWEDRQANVKNLASKIGNMPPKDGVVLLEKMEPTLAVDVIRQMDQVALENDAQSITAYILSIMDKEKASVIIRLMSKYPKNPEQ